MEKYAEILLMFVKAFAVGGTICLIAQIVINFTKLTSGRILVFFMLAGVALEGLGLYQYLVDFAGAGATVPISGFGYLLARGAMRGAEQGIFGAVTGALSAASGGGNGGGRVCLCFCLVFRPRSKKNLNGNGINRAARTISERRRIRAKMRKILRIFFVKKIANCGKYAIMAL